MNNVDIYNSSFISGVQIDEAYGAYLFTGKPGNCCNFDMYNETTHAHYHDCYEICIVTSGSGYFTYNNKTYRTSIGDVFIADNHSLHEVATGKDKDFQVFFFMFNIEKMSQASASTPEDRLFESFLKEHRTLAPSKKHLLAYIDFITTYYSYHKSGGYGVYQATKNLMLECIEALCYKSGILTESMVSLYGTFELALDYIDRHLNERILLRDIADHACTSERNVQLLFKKNYNRTVTDYINEKKVLMATHYLQRQYSLADTAAQIGISDTAQFSRLFKKYKNMTPKKYQMAFKDHANDFGRRQMS